MVLLSDVFAKNMGYLENLLPKYLARSGVDVHVIAMDLQPYYWIGEPEQTFGNFTEPLAAGTVVTHDGYTLHVLGHHRIAGYMRMVGLGDKLRSIRPDIVQTASVIGWTALDAALYRFFLGYKLFTGCHTTASVFPLANHELPWWNRERLRCLLQRTLPGRFVSRFSQKCYAVTEDCAHIASRYFGVPSEKVRIVYLGVDTEYFYPAVSEGGRMERRLLRQRLGFGEEEIVCIYTGKFMGDKKVHVLAETVEQLRACGQPFRALLIGGGPEREALRRFPSSVILDFMPFFELGPYYRAADIAVWPGNESTSMLDAAACGLPVVISDRVGYRAPVEGNGCIFKGDSVEDLMKVLIELQEPETRKRLGLSGAARMAREFGWEMLAAKRLQDYRSVLPTNEEVTDARETVTS